MKESSPFPSVIVPAIIPPVRSPARGKGVGRVVQAHHHGHAPAPADRARAVGDRVGLGGGVVAAAHVREGAQSHAAGACRQSTAASGTAAAAAVSREEGFGGGGSGADGREAGHDVSKEGGLSGVLRGEGDRSRRQHLHMYI